MAGITQTIPQYSAGISEQPDHLKFPGQVTDVVNAIPDVTKGLFKRPGSKRIGTDALSSVQSGGSWFHYFRDETEGSYIGQVAADGQVRVWRCTDGQLMTTAFAISKTITITSAGTGYSTAPTVTFSAPQTGEATNRATGVATINSSGQLTGITVTDTGTGYTSAPSITIGNQWVTNTSYEIGDQVFNGNNIYTATTNGTSGNNAPAHTQGSGNDGGVTWNFAGSKATATCVLDNTFVQNYLTTSEPENLQFLTINDTTFVCNRDGTNARKQYTTVGVTGTTDATPDAHFAFVELLRTENGRQYGLNFYNDATVQTLTRATRIKIQSDTLDETDGSGDCPGIGTEVFSVSGSDFTITDTITNIPYGTSDINGGTNNRVEFHVANGHGLKTGDQINVLSGPTAVNKVTISVGDVNGNNTDTNFFYISANNEGIHNFGGGSVASLQGPHKDKTNLIFRINTLGQQGVSPNYTASQNGPGGNNYRCSYNREVVLLHGGEGWTTGDAATVTMEGFNYTIRVEDHETTSVNANLKLVRPEPTPFDADTAVTADTILAGMKNEIDSITGLSAKIIGTGIYISSANNFNVTVVEEDLMRVMQSSVNDVTNLPNQCKHGYIVKISNSRMAEEDDYYLRFDGENSRDGSGSWSECAKPGISKTLTNMPLIIQRTALDNPGTSSEIATFTVKQFTYRDRDVGDDTTNPMPSFVNGQINKVLFFRNRLALLSGENVVLSRPGTLGIPDFFVESALTIGAADPIDISAASMFPSELFDGIEINTGLLVFSTNQQFLLSSDDTVLNPDTAKLRSVSTYNYNKDIPPISLGTTVAYVDNSNKFSRFNEMANVRREGEPNVVEVSKIVPTLLPKDIDLITNSRENSIILLGKTNSDTVFGYKYLNVGEKRQQAAWFKWKLNNPLIYHFIIDDEYFFLDSDYYLQSIKLIQANNDPSTSINNVDFLLHVDNHTTVSGGNFDSTTNTTTFSGVGWLNTVTSPNHELVVIDEGGTPAPTNDQGRYSKCTVSGTSFTVPGNWQGVTLTIGYLYPYQVKFPRFYAQKQAEQQVVSDTNSSLVIHRVKFHFGKVGLYETKLERVGKPDYKEVYESPIPDIYKASRAPYLEEHIQTVPVYEKNTNVEITLTSSHPAPATLRSLSWEGDANQKYYRRV